MWLCLATTVQDKIVIYWLLINLWKCDIVQIFRNDRTNQNCIQNEIRSILNLGITCYHSVQNLLSSCPLSKTLINQPTPWSSVLLEKLIVTQPVEKLPPFYGTWRFITVFTRAYHWFLSWTRCIQSITFQPSSLTSILILSFHLCLDLRMVSSLQVYWPNAFISPLHATCIAHLILLTWAL